MPSKTPHTNGTDPVENGINGTKDVEMKEDTPSSMKGGKSKKLKDTDEEMTVVVPPSKGSKLSATPPPDTDGDVVMNDSEKPADATPVEMEVDPVEKAISGMSSPSRLDVNS
jgi:26S proteasome regulatory subunit N3